MSDYVQHAKPQLCDNFVYLSTINALLKSIHVHQLITVNAKKTHQPKQQQQRNSKCKKSKKHFGENKIIFLMSFNFICITLNSLLTLPTFKYIHCNLNIAVYTILCTSIDFTKNLVLCFKYIAELIYNEVMSYENQGQNQGKQPAQPMQNHSGKFS